LNFVFGPVLNNCENPRDDLPAYVVTHSDRRNPQLQGMRAKMREILAGLKSAAKDLTGLDPMGFGRESGNIIPILLTRRPSMINIEAWLAFPAL